MIYIPLWMDLKDLGGELSPSMLDIYIPLWMDLKVRGMDDMALADEHLHSTMDGFKSLLVV